MNDKRVVHRVGLIVARPRTLLSNLDDKALHHLFEYIPLMEQITSVSLVCRALRESLLKKWSTLKHLKLHENAMAIEFYRDRFRLYGSWNYFPEFRYDYARTLYGPYRSVPKFIAFFNLRFPAITELMIIYTDFSSSQISRLLSTHLRGQLQLFGLFRKHDENIVDLIPVLRQLRSLKHLLLHDICEPIHQLSQLFGQLETLYLTYFMSDLFSVINRLSSKIRRLVLYAADFSNFSTREMVKIKPEIGRSVKYLALDNALWDFGPRMPANLQMFKYMMNSFTCLGEVDIPTSDGVKLEDIFKCLKNKPNLTYLKLTLYDPDSFKNITTESIARSLQLPTLKKLTIHNSLGPNGIGLRRFRLFGLIFPNLDYLKLNCCPVYCRQNHPEETCQKCEIELRDTVFDLWKELSQLVIYGLEKVWIKETSMPGRSVQLMKQYFQRFDNPRKKKIAPVLTISATPSSKATNNCLSSNTSNFPTKAVTSATSDMPSKPSSKLDFRSVNLMNLDKSTSKTHNQQTSSTDILKSMANLDISKLSNDSVTSAKSSTSSIAVSTCSKGSTDKSTGNSSSNNYKTAKSLNNFSISALSNSLSNNASSSTHISGSSKPPNSGASSYSSTVTLDDLDDNSLLCILKRCPLQVRIIYLRLVCKRWHRLLGRLLNRQQLSLKIFPSHSDYSNYIMYYNSLACISSFEELHSEDDVLVGFGGSNTEKRKRFIHYLQRRFPNVKKLLLFGMSFTESELALFIGGKWRYHLELFALFEDPYTEHGKVFQWNLIYPAISLTKNLKHLILCDIRDKKPISLSGLLPKLETLYLGYHGKDMFEVVNMLSSKARRLVLFHDELDRFEPNDLQVKIRRCVKKKLNYLAMEVAMFEVKEDVHALDRNMLGYVGRSFAGVKVLDIATKIGVKLEAILECISKLPNLYALRFRSEDPDLMSEIVPIYLATKNTPSSIPSLCQLAITNPLGPIGSFVSHFQMLSTVFPGLEYLRLINCPIYCRPSGRHSMIPCMKCDIALMEVISRHFERMRLYRYKRYRYLGVEVAAEGKRIEAFQTEMNMIDILRYEGQPRYDQVMYV